MSSFTGSFSFSVLSGKVMFRDVYYINQDMSIRWLHPLCLLCLLFITLHAHWPLLCWQDTGWLPHISLVENVQPQTKATWSVNHIGIDFTVFPDHKWFIVWVEYASSVPVFYCFSLSGVLTTAGLNLNPHSRSSSDPKAETRLYVTVNGFEFHVYNRTDLYAHLQETFGLEPTLTTPKKDEERGREDAKKTLERSDQCGQG